MAFVCGSFQLIQLFSSLLWRALINLTSLRVETPPRQVGPSFTFQPVELRFPSLSQNHACHDFPVLTFVRNIQNCCAMLLHRSTQRPALYGPARPTSYRRPYTALRLRNLAAPSLRASTFSRCDRCSDAWGGSSSS